MLEVRNNLTRHMIVNALADIERAAEGGGTRTAPWEHERDLVVDALTGMWLAPAASR